MPASAPPRRIVFSRKGLDSVAGRSASPIVDGRPVSLPIPTGGYPGGRPYGSLAPDRVALAALAGLAPAEGCHLDPDIDRDALPVRPAGWRGAFGQAGAPLTHLHRQGVGPGDLFLFFGLFRPAGRGADGRWRWIGNERQHVLFGWLRVGEVLTDLAAAPAWLGGHPHLAPGWPATNAVYLAADRLALPGAEALPGSGVFARAAVLTASGERCARWAVPPWLERSRMSYRRGDWCWTTPGRMDAQGQWQEGVAEADDEAADWAGALIAAHAGAAA